eukprot:scpid57648/ scgid13857/ Tyrosine-protein kinase FRK; Beta-cell Src-homology tyrosine kinase; FYN-related kinase; Intestine tyrosine kinase
MATSAARHSSNYPSVEFGTVLGEGGFGTVWKGKWQGRTVAIKVPKPEAWKGDFLAECTMVKKLKHPNIIVVYHVSEHEGRPYLVMELAKLGSLLDFLKSLKGNRKITGGGKRCKMAVGIADGMAYLERERVVHRDLAARNILVMEDQTCKISDFGLTRKMLQHSKSAEEYASMYQLDEYVYTTSGTQDYCYVRSKPDGPFPVRWTAPEAFAGPSTTKSDVWSFGIVLWEMMSFAATPYSSHSIRDLRTWLMSSEKNRLAKPTGCDDAVYRVMLETWALQPSKRPTFSDIKGKLADTCSNILSRRSPHRHPYVLRPRRRPSSRSSQQLRRSLGQ